LETARGDRFLDFKDDSSCPFASAVGTSYLANRPLP
jgi:hypothetical protein